MMEKKLDDVAMRGIAMTSPAITYQYYTRIRSRSGFNYPPYWHGKVPLKVKLLKRVKSDIPLPENADTIALKEHEYFAWVNIHGAVSAILPNGKQLGLTPDEFEITEWHPLLQHNNPQPSKKLRK